MKHARSVALLLLATASFGCASVESQREPIVSGAFGGPDEVVYMYRLDGAACTGALIAPRVVLTANHCVEGSGGVPAPASRFRIYVGNSLRQLTAEYMVSEVRPVPGAGLGAGQANDVALLVLTTAASQEPRQIADASPRDLFGSTVTAVGYGQTPSGGSGTKFNVTTQISGYQEGFIFVPPTVCSGDSGGPLLGPEGRVWGVASFIYSPDGRTSPVCGTAPGAYNEILRHIDFIYSVIEETGSCAPSEEICDGLDNNCDEVVDEGCIPLGDPCTADSECTGGVCRETSAGPICTSACDPLRPDQGCSLGFYCSAAEGCDGYCLRGAPGGLGLEAACTADTDCDSLFCADPGDGVQRCLQPCRGDAGLCLAGEVCAAGPGTCGGCVDQSLLVGRRGLGEPCDLDTQCREGTVCRDTAGVRECASGCTAPTGDEENPCGDGFICRDAHCIRDRTQGVGGVCGENADCGAMGICAAQSGRRWCTAPCADASECPSGFDCVPAGGTNVCAPVTALDGESCTMDAECASGTCAGVGGTGSICTSFCDPTTACAPGFECVRANGMGTNVCLPFTEEEEDGGDCSVSPGAARSATAGWLFGLAGLALLRRRRRA